VNHHLGRLARLGPVARRLSRLGTLSLAVAAASAGLVAGCQTKEKPVSAVDIRELPQNSFQATWVADLNDPARIKSVTLLKDKLVVLTDDNVAYQLTAGGGAVLYKVQIAPAGEMVRPPVQAGESTVFPSGSELVLVDPNGNITRRLDVNHAIRSSATVAGGLVTFGVDAVGGGRVIAVDVTRQYVPTLRETLTNLVRARPASYAEQAVVFAASEEGKVFAINPENQSAWGIADNYFKTGGVVADLVADEFGLFVASTDTKLYVLDRLTGKLRWTYFAGARLDQPPTVLRDAAYQYVPGKGVVAIAKSQGKEFADAKWTNSELVLVLGGDDKLVYGTSGKGQLLAVDKATGKTLFRSQRSDVVAGTASADKGTFYVATKGGQVLAVQPVLRPGTMGTLVMGSPAGDTLVLAAAR
jgi:outer membrane protein assembly factor BamB